MKSEQSLSIVIAGRNDDYDGNFNERLLIATRRNLLALPHAKLIFVEWNPVPNKPLVSSLLKKEFGDCASCYVVDSSFRYLGADQAFAEFPAKNVGIRRARSDYILVTNSDIIFSPEVVSALKRGITPGVCYTAVRIDVKLDYIDVQFPIDHSQIVGINDHCPTDAAGDFLLVDKQSWHKATAYCEEFPHQRIHKDSQMVELFKNEHGLCVERLGLISHWQHPSSYKANPAKNFVGDIKWDYRNCGFKHNSPNWGLADSHEEMRNGICWILPK